jgi:hypothetical protein
MSCCGFYFGMSININICNLVEDNTRFVGGHLGFLIHTKKTTTLNLIIHVQIWVQSGLYGSTMSSWISDHQEKKIFVENNTRIIPAKFWFNQTSSF